MTLTNGSGGGPAGGAPNRIWLDDDLDAQPSPLPPTWDPERPPMRSEPFLTQLSDPRTIAIAFGVGGLAIGVIVTSLLFLVLFDRGGGEEIAGTGEAADALIQPDDVPDGSETQGFAGQVTAAAEATASTDGSTSSTSSTTDTTGSTSTVATSSTTTPTVTTAAPTTQTTAAPTTSSTTTTAPTTASTAPSSTTTTAAPTTQATAPSTAAPGPSGGDGAIQQQILDLTNAERAKANCGALTLQPALNAAADAHSEDMAANDYFSHTSQNGASPSDRARAAGYNGGVGENIAAGYPDAASVMNGWMNSPGHRANILNCRYQHLGVGYAVSGSDRRSTIYWTQNFG